MTGRRYSDQQLVQALTHAQTMSYVLRALGLAPRGGNYENVRAHINRLGMTEPVWKRPQPGHANRSLRSVTDAELAEAVRASGTWAEVAVTLGTSIGGAFRRATRLNLDSSHFRGRGWRRGSTTPVVEAIPLSEVLVKGRLCSTYDLKRRLIAEGLKEDRCEGCLLYEWCGEPIPLELDHINGDRIDNRLENLRLLCPNCHALTPTYRGRNRRRVLA